MCVLLILWCYLHHHLGGNFQADHAALLSILRNEGVSTTGLGSKPSNNLVSQFWFVIIFLTVFFAIEQFQFFSMHCKKWSLYSLLLLLFAAPASFCP